MPAGGTTRNRQVRSNLILPDDHVNLICVINGKGSKLVAPQTLFQTTISTSFFGSSYPALQDSRECLIYPALALSSNLKFGCHLCCWATTAWHRKDWFRHDCDIFNFVVTCEGESLSL